MLMVEGALALSADDPVRAALESHDKEVECFLRERDRKWSTATAEEQDRMKREFVALLQRGAKLMQSPSR
jgi:hypothetical protein